MGTFSLLSVVLLAACSGSDSDSGVVDEDLDGFTAAIDCDDTNPDVHPGAVEICGDGLDNDCEGGDEECVTFAVLPLAPSAERFMAQGRQTDFVNADGEDCSASIVAAVSDQLACYVDASGDLLCAGNLYDIVYGTSFVPTTLEDVSQIFIAPTANTENGNAACAVAGETPTCMGRNNPWGQLGSGNTDPVAFWTEWAGDVDGVTMMAAGTSSSTCVIAGDGAGWCTGSNFSVVPAVESVGPHDTMYMDTSSHVYFDAPEVWRVSQGRAECKVQAEGLGCRFDAPLGRAGHVVDGGYFTDWDYMESIVWLEDDGKVYRFDKLMDESTVTTQIFADVTTLALAYHYYTDTICAVTDTGSMQCVGSNERGKLGTGDEEDLLEETEVLAAGTFDLSCQ